LVVYIICFNDASSDKYQTLNLLALQHSSNILSHFLSKSTALMGKEVGGGSSGPGNLLGEKRIK
jgi:hypothetical protein